MLRLIYSGERSLTNKRLIWHFPETRLGVRAAWVLIVAREAPNEEGYDAYKFDDLDTTIQEACDTVNMFWGPHGWFLELVDEPTDHLGDDADVRS